MAIDEHSKRPGSEPASDAEDTALLERIRSGDRDALHALYGKYHHSLLRFTHRITGQLELAQESVNDAMLVVWQDAAAFQARSKVATWIMGIAYRRALKLAQRSRQWHGRFSAADFDSTVELRGSDEELSTRAELEDLLEHALRALPAEQKAVVELTYYFGCSYEEIAGIVGCPINTVKTRMFHARAKLRTLLPRLGRDELR